MCRKAVVMSVVLMSIFAGSATAAISTFDSGLDGWTGGPDPIGWYSGGGNPDGYLLFNDNRNVNVSPMPLVYAPLDFLGDWSGLDGIGVLSYDHKIFSTGSNSAYVPYEVYIHSGDDFARWQGDTPNGVTDWVNIEVPIDSSEWVVKQGTWEDILSNVTQLRIRVELVSGSDVLSDIEGIDNVSLQVPEPATLSLMAIGGLLLRRRKR